MARNPASRSAGSWRSHISVLPVPACSSTTAAPWPPVSSYQMRAPGMSANIAWYFERMAFPVEQIVYSRDRLRECPIWDERAQCLWWVDIHGQAIKRYKDRPESFPLPEPVGSIALREAGGLLAAMQSGIYVWDEEQSRLLAAMPPNGGSPRFNDGRCDRAGRFWVGTLQEPDFPPTGRLFRLDGSGLELKRRGVAIPNSLAWSPDGRTMYFADTPRQTIWAFDYDGEAGESANERIFARTA